MSPTIFARHSTLIAEPVEQLAGAGNLTPSQKTLMHIADKNVRILKRLLNQILDFRAYENGKLDVNLIGDRLRRACKKIGWRLSAICCPQSRHKA